MTQTSPWLDYQTYAGHFFFNDCFGYLRSENTLVPDIPACLSFHPDVCPGVWTLVVCSQGQLLHRITRRTRLSARMANRTEHLIACQPRVWLPVLDSNPGRSSLLLATLLRWENQGPDKGKDALRIMQLARGRAGI